MISLFILNFAFLVDVQELRNQFNIQNCCPESENYDECCSVIFHDIYFSGYHVSNFYRDNGCCGYECDTIEIFK